MGREKKLSQFFLKDKKQINKIISNIDVDNEDVIEIGPGNGSVTVFLAPIVKSLRCFEIDAGLCKNLEERFAKETNVEIVHANALKYPFGELKTQVVVFSNVPYHISTRLVEHLVDNRHVIKRAYLMFQKEFVEKLAAPAGSKLACALGNYLQYYAKVQSLCDVPARAFRPAPKVTSSVVRVDFYEDKEITDNRKFLQFLRDIFLKRKKKLSNALSGSDILAKLADLGIDPELRPHQLQVEDYVKIYYNITHGD